LSDAHDVAGSVAEVEHDQSAAERLAERFVAPLGRRWRHVQAVAARATELAAALPGSEREHLIAAAWLHDIGYSPDIGSTGLHPLDGARYLRDEGWPERVVRLVAHHSGARFEAAERGLTEELSEFPFEDSPLLDALALADLTTGPAGERLTYDRRISEILSRYEPDDPVHRTWISAKAVMAGALERAQRQLEDAQPK
jgi:putative nucleotidyltransferase with HDIG domain